MKKYLILFLMSVLLACNSHAGYVVKGVFEGAGNGYAVLERNEGGKKLLDTVDMQDGKFVFEGEVPDVCFVRVVVAPTGKDEVSIPLVLENSDIEMRGDWENVEMNEEEELVIRGMTIIGSKNQDVKMALDGLFEKTLKLPEFERLVKMLDEIERNGEILKDTAYYWRYRRQYESFEARWKEEQLKIMAANPSVETAAYQLGFMMDNMPLEELEHLFGQFDAKVQASELAKEVRGSIELRRRIEPGRLAPRFTLTQRDGTSLSLADFRGKVVVLDFWASWCKPCRASFPWVREFYKAYRDKEVEIIGISIDEKKASWEKALDAEQLPWPQVIDDRENGTYRVGGLYHVLAVPMFVVIDKEGKIVVREHMERKELEAEVEKALEN